jgi:hypothetical protein
MKPPKKNHKLKCKTKARNNIENGKFDISYEIEFQ